MKVAVIGSGYVGLVAGTCFAESGNEVICVDNNPQKLAMLKAGQVPIYEPGLEAIFDRNTKEDRLVFTDSLPDAIAFADIIFLALPTPPTEDGSADLKYVLGVAGEIGKLIRSYKVIVNKSTVPVGTADKVHDAIASQTDVEFDVVSNPEFLREGVAVMDFLKPERVVIGTRSERATAMMKDLYKPFLMSGNPIIVMDERSAEVTKYAANSFLATKITFMNEIANLCEMVGANVDNVRKGMGTDSRIGKRFLFAGIGYGGSCFPKDVSALFKTSKEYKYDFRLLDSVMQVNEDQKLIMVDKIKSHFGDDLSGRTFAIWGLAFKPNTDDIREAPAVAIIKELLAAGARVKGFDPEAMESVQKYANVEISYAKDRYEALSGADAMVLCTEWGEFRSPNFEQVRSLLKSPTVFDGRNVYDPEKMREIGFNYFSIGRRNVYASEKADSKVQ